MRCISNCRLSACRRHAVTYGCNVEDTILLLEKVIERNFLEKNTTTEESSSLNFFHRLLG